MKRNLFRLLIGVALLFSACNNVKRISTDNNKAEKSEVVNITDKKWQLVELTGKSVEATINDKMPFIELKDEDKSYAASAGCNGLGGTYELDSIGKIKFTLGMSTMMYCDNMEVETEFKRVLEEADNYSANDTTLTLNKGRMAPLARFVLKSEDATTKF